MHAGDDQYACPQSPLPVHQAMQVWYRLTGMRLTGPNLFSLENLLRIGKMVHVPSPPTALSTNLPPGHQPPTVPFTIRGAARAVVCL